jgi:tetratricopeptide (TPR) repeat protein
MAYHAVATVHLIRGDWARARALIDRQIAVLREGNVGGELPIALANSARALAYLGHTSEALARRLEVERLLDERSATARAGTGWIRYSLGRACLVLGRVGEARRLATLALESASARTDFVPDTLQLLGDIATHPGRFDAETGEAHYHRALTLAEPRGMRPLVAHCHFGLGKLCARTGRREQATEHLGTAAAMYRDMDMRGWLGHAVAESSRLA